MENNEIKVIFSFNDIKKKKKKKKKKKNLKLILIIFLIKLYFKILKGGEKGKFF